MRILYIGPLPHSGTCYQRMQGLIDMGHEVVPVDTYNQLQAERGRHFLPRLMRKLIGPMDLSGINKKILKLGLSSKFDIVWVDKAELIHAETLKRLKAETACFMVHHNTDDIKNKRHRFNKNYFKTMQLYDVQFTSNTFNIAEMQEMGAKNVLFAELGYCNEFFKPVNVSDEDRKRLGEGVFFVGHWEPATEEKLLHLAKNGIPVKIHGYHWNKAKHGKLLGISSESGIISEEDYLKILSCGSIGLGIVSKFNRNLTAGRTFEIPACGTFLLAERNSSTEKLYKENEEIVLFSTPEELLEKVKYYMKHVEERETIAKAGHLRCINSGYSWKDRVKEMMDSIEEMMNPVNEVI